MEENSIEQFIMDVFMSLLDPAPIYVLGYDLAFKITAILVPILLALSIALRIGGDMVNSISGKTQWLETGKDFLMAAFFMGTYTFMMGLLIDFFNLLNDWVGKNGAHQQIYNEMANLIKETKKADFSVSDILGAPTQLFAYLFFFFTYLCHVAVFAIFNLGHALLFVACYIWGPIAIAVSINTTFNLMRGWAIMVATLLVWPILEGILFFLASSLIQNAAGAAAEVSQTSRMGAGAMIYMLWAILNCILTALKIAAPMITYSLISNSGSIMGPVAAFGTAGLGAALGVFKTLTAGTKKADDILGGAANIASNGKLGEGSLSGMASKYASAALDSHSSAIPGMNLGGSSTPEDTAAWNMGMPPTSSLGSGADASQAGSPNNGNPVPQNGTNLGFSGDSGSPSLNTGGSLPAQANQSDSQSMTPQTSSDLQSDIPVTNEYDDYAEAYDQGGDEYGEDVNAYAAMAGTVQSSVPATRNQVVSNKANQDIKTPISSLSQGVGPLEGSQPTDSFVVPNQEASSLSPQHKEEAARPRHNGQTIPKQSSTMPDKKAPSLKPENNEGVEVAENAHSEPSSSVPVGDSSTSSDEPEVQLPSGEELREMARQAQARRGAILNQKKKNKDKSKT